MNEMSDIYSALMAAKASNEALGTWVSSADGRDLVRSREREIEKGIEAYHRLSSQLRDGRKHIEPPDDYEITSCQCNAPNAAPPCSWCTRDTRNGEEQAVDPNRAHPAPAAGLTDERIQEVWQAMPGGPAGWLKEFCFMQFARAIEQAILAQQPAQAVADVKKMVDRFLGWPLPKSFSLDCGISFDGRKDDQWNKNKPWPIGTNLLNADEARQMFEYVLQGAAPLATHEGKAGDVELMTLLAEVKAAWESLPGGYHSHAKVEGWLVKTMAPVINKVRAAMQAKQAGKAGAK